MSDYLSGLSLEIDHTEMTGELMDAIDAIAFTEDEDLEDGGDFEPDDFGEDDDPREECPGDYTGMWHPISCLRGREVIQLRGRKMSVQKAVNTAKGNFYG